jgi:hypothetical protein
MEASAVKEFVEDFVAKAPVEVSNEQSVAEWLETNTDLVDAAVHHRREKANEGEVFRLFSTLSATARAEMLRDLAGFAKVQDATLKL